MKKIAVIGLGYVGLPLAAEIGKKRAVIGYDINSERISELNSHVDRTKECTYDQLKSAEKLVYSDCLSDIKDADIYIITVPTPVDANNIPDLKPLISASASVGSILNPKNIVIFESTVFPGATEEVCVPILESESGLTYNKDFYCGYSPERINPGDKTNTITKITKITSGSNYETALEVDEFYQSFITAGTYLAPSIKVAEAAKVIENSQRDLNIAFVNELSVMFDKIGLDTMEVLEAAGSKWNFLPFRPGMVGGHCIGVDPYYLTYKADEVGAPAELLLAGRKVNDNMAFYAADAIIERMGKSGLDISNSRIGVLGITFKENCPDIRNSKVFDLIKRLQFQKATVFVCDPWADPKDVKRAHGVDLITEDKLGPVDTLVVAVGHSVYRNLKIEQLRKICPNEKALLADLKSIFDRNILIDAGYEVFRL